jgi:hypothetical protein
VLLNCPFDTEAHNPVVNDAEQMKKNYWDSLAYLKEKVRCYVTMLDCYFHVVMLRLTPLRRHMVCALDQGAMYEGSCYLC